MPLETNAGDLNKVAWLFYLPAWLSGYSIADELISRNVAYVNDTPSLVPYGDRYNTNTGVEVTGIQAHPTLGAVFAILAAEGASSPGRAADRSVTRAVTPLKSAKKPAPAEARKSTKRKRAEPAPRTSKSAHRRHHRKRHL